MMQVTHDNDCEHRIGHDCTCGASNHLYDLAAARAEIERLAKERDEARAQVAAVMQDRADLAQIIDNAITPNDAEAHRLLLDGTYHTGPVVDWVHRVMIAMRDLLRKDPSKAQAALEAYGREKVQEGMRRAADIARGFGGNPVPMSDGCGTFTLRNLNGVDVAQAILAAMEKEGGE